MTSLRRSRPAPGRHRLRPSDEGGSLVLALLITLVTTTVGIMVLTSTVMTQRASRLGVDYTTVVEGADGGVQHAIAQLNGAGVVAPPATPLILGDSSVTYTATLVPNPGRPTTYEIVSTATNTRTGGQRRVVARVEEEPRFPFALFSDEPVEFLGNNTVDSYSSGVLCTVYPACAWASPYNGAGLTATNTELEFEGNATADGTVLYDWAANPGAGRCEKTGTGFDPCGNQQLKNERLDLLTTAETQFLQEMEAYCDTPNPDGSSRWVDYRSSVAGLNQTPVVLMPSATGPHHCFGNLYFDIETVLAPLVLPLDVKPVIIVVKTGGDIVVGGNGPSLRVNCELPCDRLTSAPRAQHLQIYSLTTDPVTVEPQSRIAAAMYLPAAPCQGPTPPGGGGGAPPAAGVHIFGSIICKQVTEVGGWSLHYDLALGGIGNGRYLVREWREEQL